MPRKPKPTTPFAELARSLAMTALYLNQLTVPAGLPELYGPSTVWNHEADSANVHAYVAPADSLDPDQEQQIDAMRAWAGAVGGTFQLEDLRPSASSRTGWARTLNVFTPLPDGARLTLYTILDLAPPPTPVPAEVEPDAVLAGAAR
jgi:hypothetical protein